MDAYEESSLSRLQNLKDDIDAVLSTFGGVLEEQERIKRPSLQEKERLATLRQHLKESTSGSLTTQADLLARSVKYLPPRDPKQYTFSPDDITTFTQTVTEKLEEISGELVRTVEESATKNREAERRNAEMEVENENNKAEVKRLHKRLQKVTEEMNVSKALVETMRKQVEEKNEKIARMLREKNIQLWEREKRLVLKEANQREAALRAELSELKEKHSGLLDRSKNRHQKMTEEVKREKMRADLKIRQSCDEDDPIIKAEKAERELYITEKRLAAACDELKAQQQVMVGLLNGIIVDYSVVHSKWRDGHSHVLGDTLGELLSVLYASVADGTIDSVRADLDSSYQGLAQDITGFSPQLLNLMKRRADSGENVKETDDSRLRLKPLTTRTSERDMSRNTSDTQLSPRSDALKHSKDVRRLSATGSRTRKAAGVSSPPVFEVTEASRQQQPSAKAGDEADGQPARRDVKRTLSSSSVTTRRSNRSDGNPALVNPVTGLPNIKEAVNMFPEMNDAQVRVHFSRFMTYDKNGDYTLDREEVKAALQDVRDSQVSDRDFDVAFGEIDTDGSGTLDFYEYLVLNRTLLQNSGQSSLFRETRRLSNRGQISKACVLQ
eukprot:scpid44079/ scgid3857/ 